MWWKETYVFLKAYHLQWMRKRKKRFEKEKNFERLRNNRVLNEVLGNSFAFLLNWEITIKSANLAKTFLKLIYLKQNT